MLPPDLIRVKRRKGVLYPLYAGDEELSIAKTLISVYKDAHEKTRRELSESLTSCEELGYNYKLVRGFSWVLEQHSAFESRTSISPSRIRRIVFSEAGRRVISTKEERIKILASAAFKLGISTLELEESLYADLEDEQILFEFEAVSPQDLLKEYNFSLVVSLLAHGKRLEMSYRGLDRGLEQEGAKIGETRISRNKEFSRLVVEWKPRRQLAYMGMRIETLFSKLLDKRQWTLVAGVMYPLKVKRTYRLELSSSVEGKTIKVPPRQEELIIPRKQLKPVIVSRPEGEIVVVDDLARRMRITESEVREIYEDRRLLDLGGILISEEKRDEILGVLERTSDMRLITIRPLLKALGVKHLVPVIEALGYDIDWNRERDESLVYKVRGRTLNGT